jgi:hypothetical protein
MAGTEDVPYSVSDHATPEPDKPVDDDQANKTVLLEVQKYLDEAIAEHNSLDVLDLNMPGDMNPTQQVAVHKLVVGHLRNIKTSIDGKLKELL